MLAATPTEAEARRAACERCLRHGDCGAEEALHEALTACPRGLWREEQAKAASPD